MENFDIHQRNMFQATMTTPQLDRNQEQLLAAHRRWQVLALDAINVQMRNLAMKQGEFVEKARRLGLDPSQHELHCVDNHVMVQTGRLAWVAVTGQATSKRTPSGKPKYLGDLLTDCSPTKLMAAAARAADESNKVESNQPEAQIALTVTNRPEQST